MDLNVLEKVGLTKNEINVYKSLLKLGAITAGPLTKETGLHRSRVYESLQRLIEKGLVSYKVQSNKKYFQAQNPEILISIINQKKKEIEELVPFLKTLQNEKMEKQEANVFEGYKGLKSIFNNAINQMQKNEEILVFGARSGQDISKETWESFFENFNKKRIEKRIKYKIIFNEDLREFELVKDFKKSKLTEVKFINQKTPAGINIHGENTAIIVWKKKPHAFLITSKDVSNSFREYFKVLWKQAKI